MLEREFQSLPALDILQSASMESASVVMVQFDVEADSGESMDKLQKRLDAAREELPDAVSEVTLTQASANNQPIFAFSLVGELPPRERRQLAATLRDRMEAVPGVEECVIVGQQASRVQVLVNRHRLEEIGGSLDDVSRAIESAELTVPLGRFQSRGRNYALEVERVGLALETLRQLPLRASSSGTTVSLGSVADVQRTLSEPTESSRLVRNLAEGGPRAGDALSFEMTRQLGANVPKVVQSIRRDLDVLRETLPGGVEIVVTTDRSEEIIESLSLTFSSAWQAILLVFAVLLMVLGTRESLIAGASIPITFLAAFGALHLTGQSLNNLTLMGLVIALGLLVDCFILMMEGMHEALHHGAGPLAAAAKTVRSYAVPMLSGQLTTIAAFMPLAMLDGIDGKFVQVIPLTVCIALVCSYMVAVTLSTTVGAAVLRRGEPNRLTAAVQRQLDRLEDWYRESVFPNTLAHPRQRWIVLAVAVAVFLFSALLGGRLDSIMYPATDEAQIGASFHLQSGTPLEQARSLAARIEQALIGDPDVALYTVTAGTRSGLAKDGPAALLATNEAEHLVGLTMTLVPPEQRSAPSPELAERFRERFARLSDARLEIHQIRMGPSGGSPVEVQINAATVARTEALAEELSALFEEIPGLQGVTTSARPHQPAFRVELSDEALRHHGLDRQMTLAFLRSAISGTTAATLYEGKEEVEIFVGYDWRNDGVWNSPTSPEEILSMKVSSFLGDAVPLASLASLELKSTAVAVDHLDARPMVVVGAQVAGGASPVEAAKLVQARLGEVALEPGEALTMAGDMAKSEATNQALGRALVLAAVLIFSVLVVQFSSFTQPLLIFATMPLALIGVFIGFTVVGIPMSFPAMIGVVALIGIVVNDSIVLIDSINRNRLGDGMPPVLAVKSAALSRLRPILVTSITTVIGLLPLAFTDAVWMGLCMAIVFGISLATVLTLVVIPAMYLLLARAGSEDAEGHPAPTGAGG